MSHAERPLVAFFDYPDVFEDFYPHYGVDQTSFATTWAGSSNHAWVRLIQERVADVVWYAFSLDPQVPVTEHAITRSRVRFIRSSLAHRALWNAFYRPRWAWRWRRAYRSYAGVASYVSLLSFGFWRALRRDRPVAFFVQDYATGRFDTLVVTARLLGIPVVAYHTGSSPEKYSGRFAKRWTIKRADRLIVSGRDEAALVTQRYGADPERVVVLLTPIDLETFGPRDRTASCSAFGLDPGRRYLLFVGRLEDRIKRVASLIDAFDLIRDRYLDIDLLIVGDGPDRERLRDRAAPMADRVRFIGWTSDADELAKLYNTADCLILPSMSEGFPSVVGEAMGCGTPVLASEVGGITELVEPGATGWLVQPGDADGLAQALVSVAEDPAAVRAMRPAARARAEERLDPALLEQVLRDSLLGGRA